MINWWGFTLTDKKRGVLATGQAPKRGVFTAAHTCTGFMYSVDTGGRTRTDADGRGRRRM